MSHKYNPGDIVEFIVTIDGIQAGTKAKILSYYSNTKMYSELLEKDINGRGHSAGGGKPNYCWNIKENQVKLVSPSLPIKQRVLNKIKYLDQQFKEKQTIKLRKIL